MKKTAPTVIKIANISVLYQCPPSFFSIAIQTVMSSVRPSVIFTSCLSTVTMSFGSSAHPRCVQSLPVTVVVSWANLYISFVKACYYVLEFSLFRKVSNDSLWPLISLILFAFWFSPYCWSKHILFLFVCCWCQYVCWIRYNFFNYFWALLLILIAPHPWKTHIARTV